MFPAFGCIKLHTDIKGYVVDQSSKFEVITLSIFGDMTS